MNKKISVIIPVYNVECRYPGALNALCDCIKAQTYNSFEVLLIDDGSTDNSGEICDTIAAQDSRFKVFHTENQGRCMARNFGLSKVKGDYVFFSDDDDLIHPQCFEMMVDLLEKHSDCDMVCGKRQTSNVTFVPISSPKYRIVDSGSLIKTMLQTGNNLYVWNNLFRSDIIESIKFNDTEYEDLDYMLRVCLCIKQVIMLEHYTYHWVQRDLSTAHHKRERRFVGMLKSLDYMYGHYIKNKYPEYASDLIWHTYTFYISSIMNCDHPFDSEIMRQVKDEMKIINESMRDDFMKSNAPLGKKILLPILLRWPRLKPSLTKVVHWLHAN